MIRKTLDSISVNSYSGTNNELIVPSRVQTSYAKEETYELSYSNFMVTTELPKAYTNDLYVGGTYPVTLEDNSYLYTAYMNIVSWCNTLNGVKLTMQYNYGLTVEEVEHTLEFSPVGPFYTYYDKYTDTITQSESTCLLYDGNKVENPMKYLDNQMGLGGNYTMGIPTLNSIYWIPNSASKNNEVGEYSDRFTATYEGMTATVDVVLTITSEQTGPSFTYRGSDRNDPIRVHVDLNMFNPNDVDIRTDLSAPADMQYNWEDEHIWTPSITNLYSDDDDFPIEGDFHPVHGSDLCFRAKPDDETDSWVDGPTTEGTYLKSYSMTFVYDIANSQIIDPTTGDKLDDPVAQALDGTTVTFWVEYDVTGSGPDV